MSQQFNVTRTLEACHSHLQIHVKALRDYAPQCKCELGEVLYPDPHSLVLLVFKARHLRQIRCSCKYKLHHVAFILQYIQQNIIMN